MGNLSKAEREQLKAAHDKAIQQDPSLKQKLDAAHQAMEESRKELHAAMIKVDPSVEAILEKIAPPKAWGDPRKGDPTPAASPAPTTNGSGGTNSVSTNSSATPPPPQRHGLPPGFANLTPNEQAQLKALHEQVKNDPTVVAAHDAVKSATTPEARRAASHALHQAVHDAMIKADPTVEPILAKLQPPSPDSGGGQPPR